MYCRLLLFCVSLAYLIFLKVVAEVVEGFRRPEYGYLFKTVKTLKTGFLAVMIAQICYTIVGWFSLHNSIRVLNNTLVRFFYLL